MGSTYLRKTPGGSGNQRKFTFSFWVKKNGKAPGSTYGLFDCGTSTNYFHIYFPDTHTLTVKSRVSNSTAMELVTTRVFRDPAAWYHFVVAVDSEQGTAANRCKIYVNGVQETSFSSENYGSQNLDHEIQDTGSYHYIGTNYNAAANETFEGSMAYVAFVDGQQLAPTVFGETDTATGEWKIKTSITPGGSGWGSNGFFILKDGNSVTDQSGQSNNWVVQAGTLTDNNDNPSNNFCTLDPLGHASANFTLIEGNLYSGGADNNWRSIYGTLGASSGKYYYEVKCISTSNYERFGWCTVDQMNLYQDSSGRYDDNAGSEGYGYTSDGEKSNNGGTTAGYGATWSTGHILSCAIDLDNQKIYWAKNGTWASSGDPTSGSTGTGSAYDIVANKIYVPAFASYGAASNLAFNFGNGYFRTTAITTNSGAGYSGAEGKSKFEYQPPTGYSALCTLGLNE